MTAAPRPAVFTVPPHRAFADAVAAGLLARFGGTPLDLARGVVILPNSRAVRALTDAFVRRAEAGLLLPRLVTIGDEDLDERLGPLFDPAEDAEPLPPAIDPLDRQMRLARLVQQARGAAGQPVDAAESVRLAADLGRVIDQLLVEEVPTTALRDVSVAAELSDHWAQAFDLLLTMLARWPEELARIGRMDRARRRAVLLRLAADRWRSHPPQGFVAAAGVTVSAPAVARLLRAIADLERGMVVLPGLDDEMPDEEWQALGPEMQDDLSRAIESHPQFHLKLLLDRMGVARGEVERWRWGGGHDARASRGRAINNALAPARFTGKWQRLEPGERLLSGVRMVEAAAPAEEAQAIAVAIRQALETPARTVALVTPDRALARRVAAHLKRWAIEADDSAGVPLSATPPGALLLTLAEAAAERFAPVPLLAMLKHPLVRAGEGRRAWLDGVRQLDLALRGPRPAEGLAGLAAYLREGDWRNAAARAAALDFWAEAAPLLGDLEAMFDGREDRLPPYVAVLRECATRLCGDAIWSGAAGRAAADLFAELEATAVNGPGDVRPDGVRPLLARLMEAVAVRPPQGGHPRVSIWGLIEGRLQQADLMILGGLNEGVWPSLPAPDPWLAPRIRAELGLPGLERRIGLAAHDLAGALGAPEVIVTRAQRDAAAPTVASRLWLRMTAIDPADRPQRRADHLLDLARRLDQAPHAPAPRPAPSPPVAERPTLISVTEVDRLKADPFAFYARRMLHLSALETIDADPTPAWRGNVVHAALEAWATEDGCDPGRLRDRAMALLAAPGIHPLQRALWQPRLLAAIDWIAAEVAALRGQGRTIAAVERSGRIEIAGVTLQGRVDRIDRLADGSLAIVDYKTGTPPSAKAVRAGYSMQLGLLGLIAERGGFEGVAGTAAAFEYWSLARRKGGPGFGYRDSPVEESGARGRIPTGEFVAIAAANFIDAARHWLTGDAPFTAMLHPEHAPYGDYEQLMRLDEWYGRERPGTQA